MQLSSLKSSKPIMPKTAATQKLLAFASLALLVVIFSVSSSNFLQFTNIVGILLSTAVIGVLALGSTFVIIAGGIDLSVGTVMTFSAVMTVCSLRTGIYRFPLGFWRGF